MKLKHYFLSLILVCVTSLLFGEGTKQFAPGTVSLDPSQRDTVAQINVKGFGNGIGYPNAPDESRIYFNVCNANEKVALGLGKYGFSFTTNSLNYSTAKIYYKIFDPSGNLVLVDSVGGNAKAENLPNYSLVSAGPNISGIGTGYDTTGWIFNPTTTG